MIFLKQNFCSVKCINIFLTFSEVYFSITVCKDKMVFMFFPVVFILVEIESVFLLYTEYIVKLEEMSLPLMCRRCSDTDKSAAVVYLLFDCVYNRLIYPVFSAALCSICISGIDHNVKFLQKLWICQNIIKADKGDIKRSPA